MVDTDDTRRTTDAGRRTTPRVWHKLPTGELKNQMALSFNINPLPGYNFIARQNIDL